MGSVATMATGESLSRVSVASHADQPVRRRVEIHPHLHEAMGLLLQAHDYAADLEQDAWDLAVEVHVLRAAKLTNSDLRWLSGKGLIDHAVEITEPDDCVRRFRATPLLSLNEATCVILTPPGVAAARELASREPVPTSARPQVAICQAPAADELPPKPKWDRQRRQLRVGSEIVKEFKLPSPNQETVLMAFEEEGWPPRIDDPLPPQPQLDPRRRLHDTIKALNRKQKHNLVRFRGDGSGEGIRWEPANYHVVQAGSPALIAR
jgi:hypothetical protein